MSVKWRMADLHQAANERQLCAYFVEKAGGSCVWELI
jgi:hypothetical protein